MVLRHKEDVNLFLKMRTTKIRSSVKINIFRLIYILFLFRLPKVNLI